MNALSKFNAWHKQAEIDGNPLALAISGLALVCLMASAYCLTLIAAAAAGAI